MSWVLNELEKPIGTVYSPGTAAVPGVSGTAGSAAYTYWDCVTYTGYPDYFVSNTPPDPEGGIWWNGVWYTLQAYTGLFYIYSAPTQTVCTQVYVPAVPAVAAIPGIPATPSEFTLLYNFGWNAGATGPAPLAVNNVFTWRMATSNVGSVVGLTLATAPQDNSYPGMALSVMAQSGQYTLYRGAALISGSTPFTSTTKFSYFRTNTGNIEVYVDGGLIHTEALAADVVVDSSLYSGGDKIWDAVETSIDLAPINTNIGSTTASSAIAAGAIVRTLGPGTALGVTGATTASSAIAVGTAITITRTLGPNTALGVAGATTASSAIADGTNIAITRTLGPNTALGVAGATTASDAIAGAVTVNGSVLAFAAATTASSAVGDDANMGAVVTLGAGTALGVAGATTASDVGGTGDDITADIGSGSMAMLPLTAEAEAFGTGIASVSMLPLTAEAVSFGTGIASVSMLPLTAAASGPNVATGWTGNFEGDSVNMLPMTSHGNGGLATPTIGIGACVMAPLSGNATGVAGEVSTSSAGAMLPLTMLASEGEYGEALVTMLPMWAVGSEEGYEEVQNLSIEISETLYAATSPMQLKYVNKITEAMTIADIINTFYNPAVSVNEQVIATDRLLTAYILQLAEQFTTTDSLDIRQLVNLAEMLVASGVVTTVYSGVVELLSAMTASDNNVRGVIGLPVAYARNVSDAVTIADAQQITSTKLAQIIEAMTISGTASVTLTILADVSEEISAGDNVELTAQLLAEILDTVGAFALLKTASEIAQGWVMNTEGTLPISEYDNYEFNSLTSYRGEFYGTSDSGLYKMGANDDAGVGITAELSSMMLDLGSSKMKRIRSAYMGYTSDGELILKVRSVSDGLLSEHWYKASQVTSAAAPREGYTRVGQGLRSRYWQFELTNVDGADFEIDQLELHPLFLGRRV
jgi:hypothetical protein